MTDEHAPNHAGHGSSESDRDDHAGHTHGHEHGHGPKDFGLAFAVGVFLNTGFVIVEAVYGLLSNSMALLADAGHNFSDVLGLLIAWGATILAKRKPGGRYSYGLRSSSIVAALINALFLIAAISIIAFEAIQRFANPAAVGGKTVIIVAAVGIVINTVTALMFMRGSKGDINVRGAFLHMAADAAVSAGVVVAGFLILATGWSWIDPAVSLAIVAVIAVGTWGLLRDSVNMSLHAIPSSVDPAEVAEFLRARPGVAAIHDLHIWSMSTTETALTVHLVIPAGFPGDTFIVELAHELKSRFAIDHPTVQIEIHAAVDCAFEPDDVV